MARWHAVAERIHSNTQSIYRPQAASVPAVFLPICTFGRGTLMLLDALSVENSAISFPSSTSIVSIVPTRPAAAGWQRMTLYLLNPIGSAGDVHPYIALGMQLLGRGADVRLLTTPNYSDLVESHGLRFVSVGEPLDAQELARNERLKKPYTAWKSAIQWAATGMMRQIYRSIHSLHQPHDTIVVSPLWSLGARLARETLPITLVNAVLNPCLLRSFEKAPVLPLMPTYPWLPSWIKRVQYWMADHWVLDPLLKTELNEFRSELRLDPIGRIMNRWWYSPDLVLGLFSAELVEPVSDWPVAVNLVGHTLWDPRCDVHTTHMVDQFLERFEKPVAIVPGSSGPGSRQFLQTVINACLGNGHPVLLLTPFRDFVPGDLPANVLHCDYVPLGDVLRRCSAIVHRGCMGTASQSLAAGIPQLVLPQVNDQFDNADRLVRLGVAHSITSANPSLQRLKHALAKLHSNKAMHQDCLKARPTHEQSSVHRIVEMLMNLPIKQHATSTH